MERGKPLERRTALRADPERTRQFRQRARAAVATKSKPRVISPATPAQRQAVAERTCLVCPSTSVDPAHLIDRSLCPVGADAPLAVVPLCRQHHRDYDEGRLDLLPYESRFREELVFAVLRHGLLGTLQRVTNSRWHPAPAVGVG